MLIPRATIGSCDPHISLGPGHMRNDGGSSSFGWFHEKEIMNGKPDTLKGSYYANPIVDKPTVSAQNQEAHPNTVARISGQRRTRKESRASKWPSRSLGSTVGSLVAGAIDTLTAV